MPRDRLTITLQPEVIAAADLLVDGSRIRNRSHAIEHLMKEGLALAQFRQAFLFVEPDWQPELFTQLLERCADAGIKHLFLSLSSSLLSSLADLQTLIAASPYPFTSEVVPADFGSGGAIALKKAQLTTPFLLAWVTSHTVLPTSLIPAYTFHRSQQAVVTQLLTPTDNSYSFSQLAIANPDLSLYVPAGMVELEQSVFPELLNLGKLSTYATH